MKSRITARLVLASIASMVTLSPTFAQSPADNALERWITAVVSADPELVDQVLAPEFQLVRGNGHRYDATSYVGAGLPSIQSEAPTVIDPQVTIADDTMVVSYFLEIEMSDGGETLTRLAPRLTVFRRIGDAWHVSAHANFAMPAD